MRTHELSRSLEQLARLLRRLPDMELDSKDFSFLQNFLPGIEEIEKKPSNRSLRPLSSGIQDKLTAMSPAEVEKFLLSDDEAFTVADLADLAEQLGLTSSKRKSKHALVNMITRHYEASKMHSILRNRGLAEE